MWKLIWIGRKCIFLWICSKDGAHFCYVCVPKCFLESGLKWKKSKVRKKRGFTGLHDFAMSNFGLLFLKSLACSLAHIKLVLSEALFNLKLCSQAEELARHLLQNPNKYSKFLTSGLPLAANLIPFKGRSGWLTWFLVKPCLQLNMRVLGFAGAVDKNVIATHPYPVSRKIFQCVFCILYIVIWLTITDMPS